MISGIEWIIILFLVLAVLIFGPSKIPELAKAIGRARREYEKASKGLDEETNKIIELAKSLGINVEGKTIEQIAEEIKFKVHNR